MADDEERRRAREEMAKRPIVHRVPGMDDVEVRRDQPFGDAESDLRFDLYLPPGLAPGDRRPAVVFVYGFSRPEFARGLKDMNAYVSWGRLLAASGMVAVAYAYRDPVADVRTLLAHLRANAASLSIDPARLAAFSFSGSVPRLLALLMDEPPDTFRCAVFAYGLTLDEPGNSAITEVAAHYGIFAATGREVKELPASLPLFVLRAGRDQTPGLNPRLDRFVAEAIACNLPLTFANHPTGPHAFDLLDDSEVTHTLIGDVVAYLRTRLDVPPAR
jgi:hypothetical protein